MLERKDVTLLYGGVLSAHYLPASTGKSLNTSSSSSSSSPPSNRGGWNFLLGTDPTCSEGAGCNLVKFISTDNHRVKTEYVTGCCKCFTPLHTFCGNTTSESRFCKACSVKDGAGSSVSLVAGRVRNCELRLRLAEAGFAPSLA